MQSTKILCYDNGTSGSPHRGKVSIAHGAKPWGWRPPQWHHQHSLFGYQVPLQTRDIILHSLIKLVQIPVGGLVKKKLSENTRMKVISKHRGGKVKQKDQKHKFLHIIDSEFPVPKPPFEMSQTIPCKNPLFDRIESSIRPFEGHGATPQLPKANSNELRRFREEDPVGNPQPSWVSQW